MDEHRKRAPSLSIEVRDKLKPIIEKLYNEEHYSAEETGKRLNPPLPKHTILALLRRFGITIRRGGHKHKLYFDNNKKIIIDDEIQEIFDGIMLGDGSMSHYSLVLSQSVERRDWIDLVETKFKEERQFDSHRKDRFPKSSYIKSGPNKGKLITRNPNVSLTIHSCDWFQEERKRWYPMSTRRLLGQKIVPTDVRITPRSVAHWYMGDGNLCQRMLGFATNCFTKEECEFLVIKLNKLIRNTNFHINKQTGHVKKYGIYYAIQACRINDIKLFTKTVQPYITKSFTYKLQQKKQLKISRNYHRIYDRHYRHGGEVK